MTTFFSWQHAILKSGLEPTTKLVCHTIGCHMAADGSGCFPSYATIAEESGLGRRTVIYHVDKAVEAGYLEVDPRQRPNGSASSNIYRQRFPDGGAPDALGGARAAPGGGAPDAPPITDHLSNNSDNPPVSPTTKATSRAVLGQTLSEHLGGNTVLPSSWANWCSAELGWSQDRIDETFDGFHDYWTVGKGRNTRGTKWFSRFKVWCRKEHRPEGARPHRPGRHDTAASAIGGLMARKYGAPQPGVSIGAQT